MIAIKSYTATPSPRDRVFYSLSGSPSASSPKSYKSPSSPEPSISTESATTNETRSSMDERPNSPIEPISNNSLSPAESTDFTSQGDSDINEDCSMLSKSLGSLQELTLQTTGINSDSSREGEGNPLSVIHAPLGFSEFQAGDSPHESTLSSTHGSDITVQALNTTKNDADKLSPISPPPLSTKVEPWSDRATPRAQTRQEVDALNKRSRPNSLEDIPENFDQDSLPGETETEDETEITDTSVSKPACDHEINALKTALSECWTLCNTLANLSSIHRDRLFKDSGKGNTQAQAWKSCWNLCQNLYDNRNESIASQVRPTLDLCREFCQALFEIRTRENEVADSILRVSFELNNHLYHTHDRNLPEAFRERTLDFYITLCHRLMKQRAQLSGETDSLLRACWALAEMLFNLRQSRRESKSAEVELFGSAVQACWDLCDLFREGWSQVRPDRRTPRATQTTFTQAFYQAQGTGYSAQTQTTAGMLNPETPTTVFDDTATAVSPDQAQVPNILVLGAGNAQSLHPNWTGNTSSILTGYSRPSSRSSTTSSTHTVKSPYDDPNLTCLKLLIVRAAMNSGFQTNGVHSLPSFVKALSSDAFGSSPWQSSLLMNYKKLVTADPTFNVVPPPASATAPDIARAVQLMIQHNGQYAWLLDLYRLVFGFRTDEAIHGSSVAIHI